MHGTQQYLLLPQPKLTRRTRHTCCFMTQPNLAVMSPRRRAGRLPLAPDYHGGLSPHCHDPLALQSPPGNQVARWSRAVCSDPLKRRRNNRVRFTSATPATNSFQTKFNTAVMHLDSFCVMFSKFHGPRFRHAPPPGSRTQLTPRKRIPTTGVLLLV